MTRRSRGGALLLVGLLASVLSACVGSASRRATREHAARRGTPPSAYTGAPPTLRLALDRPADLSLETPPCEDGVDNCELSAMVELWWVGVDEPGTTVLYVERDVREGPMAEDPCEPKTRVRLCGVRVDSPGCLDPIEGTAWSAQCVLPDEGADLQSFFDEAASRRIDTYARSNGAREVGGRIQGVEERTDGELVRHRFAIEGSPHILEVEVEASRAYDFRPVVRLE